MDAVLAQLIDQARAARLRAYAPYSKFLVGAAIRTPAGNYYSGGNVENAAYPEGWCAETSAIAAMVQAGERQIAEFAVLGDGSELCTPCGGCRQRIREFASAETPIHICGLEGLRQTFTLAMLLPNSFGPDNLA